MQTSDGRPSAEWFEHVADGGGLVFFVLRVHPDVAFEFLNDAIETQIAANAVLGRDQLAIDGNDLIVEFGMPSGRLIGRLLDDLTERVVAEPALNDRAILLDLARRDISDRRLVDNRSL